MKKLLLSFGLILGFWPCIFAQEKIDLQSFYERVEGNNPQLRIAEIQRGLGDIEQQRAKGFLDPEITSSLDEKNFNNTRYYRLFDAQLRVPLNYGIDIIGGYQNSLGSYVNPQSKTPDDGLYHLGIEVNLLQGLWVNEARMSRREAENTAEMYRQKAQITKNDFYFSAGYNYLNWEQNQAVKQLYQQVINLSKNYYEQTRETYLLGEKTAIDTLESYIAWQDWQAQAESLQIEENKLTQNINFYLFNNQNINTLIYSGKYSEVEQSSEKTAINQLPVIREKEEKLAALYWQEKLKREKLKPKLKVKFSPLVSDYPTGNYSLEQDNYKWGFGFSYNLFNRKAKADLRENQSKQAILREETNWKIREIEAKTNATSDNLVNLKEQYDYWKKIADGYEQLMEAEKTKFEYGESSVFLLTKRQEKWLQTRKKMIAIYYKWQQEKLYYLYLNNQIGTVYDLP